MPTSAAVNHSLMWLWKSTNIFSDMRKQVASVSEATVHWDNKQYGAQSQNRRTRQPAAKIKIIKGSRLCCVRESFSPTASIIGLESSGRLTVFCGLNTEPTCWESSLRAKLSTGLSYFQCTVIADLLVYFVYWKVKQWQHWTFRETWELEYLHCATAARTTEQTEAMRPEVVWIAALGMRACHWGSPTVATTTSCPKHW